MMDPIGYGLQHFDAVGQFRELESGEPVDATGELDGVSFDGALELSQALIAHEGFPRCLARQLFRSAAGRVEEQSEARTLDSVGDSFRASGFDFVQLQREVVLSEGFRFLSLPESP